MTIRVLVVEDESHARSAIEEFLDLSGFDVRGVSGAREALSEGAEFRPDVLLCDYLLPGSLNGIEVATRLLADLPRLKIIMMTGLPRSEVEPALGPLANCPLLSKPLSLTSVRDHIVEAYGC